MATRKIPKDAQFVKDPNDLGDYEVRWTHFLAANSDQVSTGTFNILTGDGELMIANEYVTPTSMYVWFASGTHQQQYEIENVIHTVGGRRWNRSILIKVVER
jgi:hypothetical protein